MTDVRNFGFFVDVPGLAMSGLVPLSGLNDDFYVFDPRRNQLVGRRTRRVIRLGDKVTVQVAKVDTFKRQVDFALAAPVSSSAGGKPLLTLRSSRRGAGGLTSSAVNQSDGKALKAGRPPRDRWPADGHRFARVSSGGKRRGRLPHNRPS